MNYSQGEGLRFCTFFRMSLCENIEKIFTPPDTPHPPPCILSCMYIMYCVSELSSLVDECIVRINETGAVVVNLTCDNPATNWAMLENLGAKINYRKMKTTLSKKNVIGIPIFVTLDACHLMKLLRNCFGSRLLFPLQ